MLFFTVLINMVVSWLSISIFYSGYSVVKGQRTPGNFISFITGLFMLYEPVKSLSRINNVIQQGVAAGTRVVGGPAPVADGGARRVRGQNRGVRA